MIVKKSRKFSAFLYYYRFLLSTFSGTYVRILYSVQVATPLVLISVCKVGISLWVFRMGRENIGR